MKTIPDKDLSIQLKSFEDSQKFDENEAFNLYGVDLNNPEDLFNAIYLKNINNSNNIQKFTELLQMIFQFIDDDNINLNSNFINRFETVISFLTNSLRDISLKGKLIHILSDKSTQTSELIKEEKRLYLKKS